MSVKPKIQTALEYRDVAVPVIQRNCRFMESNWYIVKEIFKYLYRKYSSENFDSPVFYGTFLKLKLFYVSRVTAKDVDMC